MKPTHHPPSPVIAHWSCRRNWNPSQRSQNRSQSQKRSHSQNQNQSPDPTLVTRRWRIASCSWAHPGEEQALPRLSLLYGPSSLLLPRGMLASPMGEEGSDGWPFSLWDRRLLVQMWQGLICLDEELPELFPSQESFLGKRLRQRAFCRDSDIECGCLVP